MYKFKVDNMRVGQICRWLKENDIKHLPVRKISRVHYFEFYTYSDAIAFKLRWGGEPINSEKERDYA